MTVTTDRARAPWFAPTLRHYRSAWGGPDVLAGLSAGAVVVPQAMAYATIADLPVQVGLYTCMVPMLVYAVLGGSRAMSVSTTSTIATLTATTLVTAGVAAGSSDALGSLTTLTLLVGLVLLAARVLHLGSLVENISSATLVGVQVGVGSTVAVGQLPKLLGVDTGFSGHGFVRAVVAAVEALPRADGPTMLLAAASIAVLVLGRRLLPRVPWPLVVVVAGIVLVAVTGPDAPGGLRLIDPVPSGLPVPHLPTFQHVPAMLPGVFAIATMAFLESAAVARGIRRREDPPIDSDRELLATAAASTLGSFFQVLPAAGGFSQSAVNQGAGARSQLSGIVTAVLAVVVALFLGPVLGLLPQATLAALVFTAVIGLIDVRALIRLARISRRDFWIAAATAFAGLTVGLLPAVLVGVLGTFGVVLRELNRVRIDDVHRSGGDLALTVGGPLYTANVLGYSRAVLAAVGPDTRRVLLDLHQMRQTSVTVLDALEDLDHELEAHGVLLVVVSVPEGAAVVARRTSWFRHLEEAGRARTATAIAPAPAPAEAPSPERGDPVPPDADPAQNGSSPT